MVNIKLILDIIAIPFGLIATFVIIFRNKQNIANILIGITAFLGGVVSVFFGLLKEIFYPQEISNLFVKLAFLSLFLMTIPVLSFCIFFWKAKFTKIPNWIHFLSFVPSIVLAIWLFSVENSISAVETPFGINNFLTKPLIIYSLIIIVFTLGLFSIVLYFMRKNTKYFPKLRRRITIFTIIFGGGFGGSFLSLYLFQYIFQDVIQPYALIMILTTISMTIAFSTTLSKEEKTLWHGCPKLIIDNGNGTCCLNTEDGLAIEVKLLDLGNIIERIQLDADILKSGCDNCTNIVFSDKNGIVRCLTTHQPIKVLNEDVTKDEMELAREMDIMNGNELCSECLHKIIAYKKEHKNKTNFEIKKLFLGMRAEEFFGVS